MNNSELIDFIAANSSVLKKDAKVAIELLAAATRLQLRRGSSLVVTGLGKFEVKRTKARVGRNPKTRAVINVPAKKKSRFVATKKLDDFINGR